MQAWQIGMATAAGTLILANPVQAANGSPVVPYDSGAGWALLIAALVAGVALTRRRREARVTC